MIKKIHTYLFALLSFCLPLYEKIIPLIIILLVITTALTEKPNIKKLSKIQLQSIIGLILFYLIHLASVAYSTHKNIAWFDLQVKLGLLIFPLIYLWSPEAFIRNKKNAMKGFVIGSLLASLICLAYAFIQSVDLQNGFTFNAAVIQHFSFFKSINYGGNHFFYNELSTFHHPTYFAIFLLLAIVFLNLLEDETSSLFGRKAKLLMTIFFSLMIFLLSSKTVILCGISILITYLLKRMMQTKTILPKLISLTGMTVLVVIFLLNPRFENLYKQLNKKDSISRYEDLKQSSDRMQVWMKSIDIISKNIYLGVGAGDIKNSLYENAKADKMMLSQKRNLNVHNQFLETFVGQGILGFSFLIGLFILAIIQTKKHRNKLLGLFIFIVMVNFMTESMLNKQSGIVFFSFFYLLFITDQNKNKVCT